MAAPDIECTADNIDQLAPDPDNPNGFWQCMPYGWQAMPCPAGLIFTGDRCEHPDPLDE
jgi:Chitin binding Peritrophin-A domain